MYERAGQTFVRATSNIEVGQLMLPPCAPHRCSLISPATPLDGVVIRVKQRSMHFLSDTRAATAQPDKTKAVEETVQLSKTEKKRQEDDKRETLDEEIDLTENVSCTAFTLMPDFKLPTFKASGGETAIAPPAVAETPPADAGRIVVATTMDEWRFWRQANRM